MGKTKGPKVGDTNNTPVVYVDVSVDVPYSEISQEAAWRRIQKRIPELERKYKKYVSGVEIAFSTPHKVAVSLDVLGSLAKGTLVVLKKSIVVNFNLPDFMAEKAAEIATLELAKLVKRERKPFKYPTELLKTGTTSKFMSKNGHI